MRTVSVFKNGNNQAVRLPKDFEFEGVTELEIRKSGDEIILKPVRPTWSSFAEVEAADDDFMITRESIVDDQDRMF